VASWLVKSDPETYGLANLERDRKTLWDGVANAVAVRNIRAVRRGDSVLVYHTGDDKAVVGLGRAASDGRDDARKPKLAVFDLEFVRRFAFPVPLAAIKADARFAEWALVRQPRLSVMPVPEALYRRVLAMAGEKQ
jgi:predicted RNA-binding protein with PUA-like domain